MQHQVAPEDWAHAAYDPDWDGTEWRDVEQGESLRGDQNILEAVFVKEPRLKWYQTVFAVYTHLDE